MKCLLRSTIPLSEMEISCGFFWMIRDSVPIAAPAASEATGADDFFFLFFLKTRWSSEEETSCAIIQKGDMTVQRCKISDESLRHALPMGEHIHIFLSPPCDLSACTALPVSTFAPKRVMDVEWGFMFFWERAFREGGASSVAVERRWTALQIFHIQPTMF